MPKVEAGKYHVAPTGGVVSYSQNKNLMIVLMFDFNGHELRNYTVIVKADGTVNMKAVANLQECFPDWNDISNPYWFMDTDLTGYIVEVEVSHEEDSEGVLRARAKWVNPVGSGKGGDVEVADRRQVMAQFGAQLRAVAGKMGKPVTPPATPQAHTQAPAAKTPPTAPATPPTQRNAPSTTPAEPADMNTAWNLLCKLTSSMNDAQREKAWFDIIDNHGGDVTEIDDWQAVVTEIDEKHGVLPF